MCTSPAATVQQFPRTGGVDVVPPFLPLHVSDSDRNMTVAEYFGLDDPEPRDTP